MLFSQIRDNDDVGGWGRPLVYRLIHFVDISKCLDNVDKAGTDATGAAHHLVARRVDSCKIFPKLHKIYIYI